MFPIFSGELLEYLLEIDERCREEINTLVKKNRQLEIVLAKAIERVMMNPNHFKTLRWPLSHLRRVHVFGSFVLVYKILENEKIVRILRFAHHDEAYRC